MSEIAAVTMTKQFFCCKDCGKIILQVQALEHSKRHDHEAHPLIATCWAAPR